MAKQVPLWFDTGGSMKMDDIPTKQGVKGTNVYWNATSSVIINGKRITSVNWGFDMNGKTGLTSINPPVINNNPSTFHKNGIKDL